MKREAKKKVVAQVVEQVVDDQRVALVTGATRGIGLGIAKALARDGFALAITGTRAAAEAADAVDALTDEGVPVFYVQGNNRDPEARTRVVSETLARYGRIDVLVNNAGVAPEVRRDLLEMTEESMDRVLDINLKGTFFLTQRVANEMIRLMAGGMPLRPAIVNVSSVSAYTVSTARGEYCISKAGLSMVTQLFADRLAEHGIGVYEVRPGIIRTDMTAGVTDKYDALIDGGLTPIKRWGTPEDVADAVSLLCGGRLGFSTGDILNVDGGFHIRRL